MRLKTIIILFLLINLTWAPGNLLLSAAAEDTSSIESPVTGDSSAETIWTREHLFGDWGGLRPSLEKWGLTFDLEYTADFFGKLSGGLTPDDVSQYLGDFSLYLDFDTEKTGWWHGGILHLQFEELHGHGLSERYVGDFQYLDDFEAQDFMQISEFWFRQSFWEDKVWIKLGKMDANYDFAALEFGCEYIHCEYVHSSFGFAPTIPMTTYPDQDLGAVIGLAPVDWFSMNLGVYQGDSNGRRSFGNAFSRLRDPFYIIEPVFHYHISGKPGHFHLGAWSHGGNMEELSLIPNPNLRLFDSSQGYYALLHQVLYTEPSETDESSQGLGAFLQYGWAPGDRSEAQHYFGGGMIYSGLIPSRDEDDIGLGIAHLALSNHLDPGGDETAVELFYRCQVTGWMTLKPDVQYIFNPGGQGSDALVMGLRVMVSF